MSEVTWRRGNSLRDSLVFWARSKLAALMLAVFLLPFLWNRLILLIDRLANTAKEEKEITASNRPLIPDFSLTDILICCDNE